MTLLFHKMKKSSALLAVPRKAHHSTMVSSTSSKVQDSGGLFDSLSTESQTSTTEPYVNAALPTVMASTSSLAQASPSENVQQF